MSAASVACAAQVVCNGTVSSEQQPAHEGLAPAGSAAKAEQAEEQDAPPFVIAWQPITPRGVASFARASFANALLLQLFVSALSTAALFWFLHTVWFPDIREAIRHLPHNEGVIRSGLLHWPSDAPLTLLDSRFLGCAVEPAQLATVTLASDVRVRFHRQQVKVCSLFGCAVYDYPKEYIIELSRREAEPWWGAWQPVLLGFVAVGLPLLLVFLWAALATLYCPVAWLLAFFADRELSWGGSWRLASAALLPGALLFSAAVVAYGLQSIDLVKLLVLAGLHLLLGWVYVVVSPFFLPRLTTAPPSRSRNPFAAEPSAR